METIMKRIVLAAIAVGVAGCVLPGPGPVNRAEWNPSYLGDLAFFERDSKKASEFMYSVISRWDDDRFWELVSLVLTHAEEADDLVVVERWTEDYGYILAWRTAGRTHLRVTTGRTIEGGELLNLWQGEQGHRIATIVNDPNRFPVVKTSRPGADLGYIWLALDDPNTGMWEVSAPSLFPTPSSQPTGDDPLFGRVLERGSNALRDANVLWKGKSRVFVQPPEYDGEIVYDLGFYGVHVFRRGLGSRQFVISPQWVFWTDPKVLLGDVPFTVAAVPKELAPSLKTRYDGDPKVRRSLEEQYRHSYAVRLLLTGLMRAACVDK
jgi:hypothetical protein